jgi:hypothetical protein
MKVLRAIDGDMIAQYTSPVEAQLIRIYRRVTDLDMNGRNVSGIDIHRHTAS